MPPGQVVNKLLTSLKGRVSLREQTHVLQVGGGKALEIRKLGPQVAGQLINDLRPPLLSLPVQDALADSAVQGLIAAVRERAAISLPQLPDSVEQIITSPSSAKLEGSQPTASLSSLPVFLLKQFL